MSLFNQNLTFSMCESTSTLEIPLIQMHMLEKHFKSIERLNAKEKALH